MTDRLADWLLGIEGIADKLKVRDIDFRQTNRQTEYQTERKQTNSKIINRMEKDYGLRYISWKEF